MMSGGFGGLNYFCNISILLKYDNNHNNFFLL